MAKSTHHADILFARSWWLVVDKLKCRSSELLMLQTADKIARFLKHAHFHISKYGLSTEFTSLKQNQFLEQRR